MIYIDGQFYTKADAKISVFDHGLLYGDGVFEGIRAYDGLCFCLDEHIDRLYRSARAIALEIPISKSAFADIVIEVLRRNDLRSGYVRPIVTRGVGDLGLDPRKCPTPSIIVMADRLTLYPAECYEHGLEIAIVSTRRNLSTALSPQIKSLNYLNNILARLEVNRMGVGEGLMLNAEGHIAEATADNVFIVRGDFSSGKPLIETPAVHCGALPGITRRCVMDLAARDGFEIRETTLTPYDIYTADECFLTGTGAEVVPVRAVEGRPVGDGKPGPVTKRLIELFREVTKTRGRRF